MPGKSNSRKIKFKQIMLKDRAISDERTIEILNTGSYGVLSTIGEDGYPYGFPLNYTYFDNCICFHCAQQGHKLDNIKFNEKVSLCVVTNSDIIARKFDTNYESAIVFGKAGDVTDETEKREILLSVINKYSSEYLDAGKNYIKKYWDDTKVIKIKIEHYSGKAHE